MRTFTLFFVAALAWGAADVPPKFASAGPDALHSDEASLQRWWLTLNDAELNSLIARCIGSNLDLDLARQRVLEARAMRQISRADLFPTVESSDSVQRIRGGFNQGIIHVAGQGGAPGLISAFETNAYQLGFDASWEIDFFGGKRHALEAATAEVRANEEARRDVLVLLLAETARDYLELRGAQRQLELTNDNIALQKDSLHLTEVRADAGLGNRLDLERQRAQLESTNALVPQLQLRIAQQIHALSVLLGQPPAFLQNELAAVAPLPHTPPEVPAGLPADLLKRRPDIREADAETAAASARIGVAHADFFPKITLTGAAGRQSADWSGFTLGAGNFFSFGPGVKLPLFTGGRLKANYAVQKQRYEESLTSYRSTVLRSLRETEDGLEAYNRERERGERLSEAVRASELATKLARDVYTGGLADFLSVLDAQREQLQAETDLVVSNTAALTDLVALYKALGGGWEK
jgi:NodT family efflux transporter outer membrane factor (OMF) lipoprotein